MSRDLAHIKHFPLPPSHPGLHTIYLGSKRLWTYSWFEAKKTTVTGWVLWEVAFGVEFRAQEVYWGLSTPVKGTRRKQVWTEGKSSFDVSPMTASWVRWKWLRLYIPASTSHWIGPRWKDMNISQALLTAEAISERAESR